ncbi:ABC transporter permease [Caulobacter mirabilis]|uniref:ABC transporter permease n=1 Tax=Caulobacter mirabilis TaxID=69666 RepID=A0A2D2AWM1_9CAUL|nr:ABC transporter permease [Caulobacter mirabilis]ATQ42393.1 ABC transporter permease [Caulobacter mirabilis]
MRKPADFDLQQGEHGATATLKGDWTTDSLGEAGVKLAEVLAGSTAVSLDLTKVRRCDTAGAYAIVRAADGRQTAGKLVARPETQRLLDLVSNAIQAEPCPDTRKPSVNDFFARVGRGVVHSLNEGLQTFGFTGQVVMSALRAIINPSKIRWASIVTLCERAGLDALPIVAITTFFIGAVIALLGVNILADFGAQVFVVELIGVAVLREFGIVITAVLLAGRSASAFAAEIGAMKMNQEIDAMRVMGVDPFDALVLPRFIALTVMIFPLTFVADLAGLAGGLLVTWTILDLSPTFFLQRIADNVGVTHFLVGMAKAPVMAAAVAGIGARQGMEVGGDVVSLGQRVTAAVVHAIFAIILIDAVFALIYMELNV